jgi:hypothetical protein
LTNSSDSNLNANIESPVLEKSGINSPVLGINYHVIGRYVLAKTVEDLAIRKYRKNGMGITYSDLRDVILPEHRISKKQAQDTLYYHTQKGTLFTKESLKPQRYYPKCLEAEILSKSPVVDPTYLSNLTDAISGHAVSCMRASNVARPLSVPPPVKANSLDEVFKHLPYYPPLIHKLQMKTKVDPDYIIRVSGHSTIPQATIRFCLCYLWNTTNNWYYMCRFSL